MYRCLQAAGPGPLWGAYGAPPDLLVGWGGDTPPNTLLPRRLRRLDLGAPLAPHRLSGPQHTFLATPMIDRVRGSYRPHTSSYLRNRAIWAAVADVCIYQWPNGTVQR